MVGCRDVISRISNSTLRARIEVFGGAVPEYRVKYTIWEEVEASGPINDLVHQIYRGNSPEEALRAIDNFWEMRDRNEV